MSRQQETLHALLPLRHLNSPKENRAGECATAKARWPIQSELNTNLEITVTQADKLHTVFAWFSHGETIWNPEEMELLPL